MDEGADDTARIPKIGADEDNASSEDANTSVLGNSGSPGQSAGTYGAYADGTDGGTPADGTYSGVSAGAGRYGAAGADRGYAASTYATRTPPASGWSAAHTGTAAAARPPVRHTSPRQARLTVSRFDTWSVMKFSFMISLVCFVILFVAVAVLYGMLDLIGVFSAIQNALASVTSSRSSAGVSVARWLSASTILGWTAILGVLDVVLITLLSTVGAAIYNLVSGLVGGVEVTLRETE